MRGLPPPLTVALITAASLAVLGLLLLVYDIGELIFKLRFATTYGQRLDRFIESWSPGQYDRAEYDWLLRRSPRMQADLGTGGIMDYKPAGSLDFIPRYAVLVNTLPTIADGSAHQDVVRQCEEMLVRHAGSLEDRLRSRLLTLLNPVRWLLRGLDVPARLLVAIGILKPTLGESPFFRLLTLTGIVVGILANWDGATAFLRSLHVIP